MNKILCNNIILRVSMNRVLITIYFHTIICKPADTPSLVIAHLKLSKCILWDLHKCPYDSADFGWQHLVALAIYMCIVSSFKIVKISVSKLKSWENQKNIFDIPLHIICVYY